MQTGSFYKGLSWLLVLNLLVKPVWIFFIDRPVQNIVGHEVYGNYFALLNLAMVLSFLADIGISNMLNQRLARGEQVPVRQLLSFKIVLILLYAALCFFIAWITGITAWTLLVYLVAIQALNSVFIFLRNIITAHQFFSQDAWLSVIDKFLMIVLCGAIIYGAVFYDQITLLLFLKIQLISTAIAVSTVLLFIINRRLLTYGNKEQLRGVLRRTMPFAMIILLMGVHYRLDGFLLERMHPDGALEAGMYAAAFRLLDASNMVGYLSATFLVPFIARHYTEREVIEKTIRNSTHSLLFFGIGVAVFCISFAPWIQQLLYHSDQEYLSAVLQLCIAALPAYLLVHVYGSALMATGSFGSFTSILVISVAVNITANILLIPSYGAMGCCIAALISQYFSALSVWIIAVIKLGIRFDYSGLISYILLAAMLAAMFYGGKMLHLNVWLILAVSALVTLILLTLRTNNLKKLFIY